MYVEFKKGGSLVFMTLNLGLRSKKKVIHDNPVEILLSSLRIHNILKEMVLMQHRRLEFSLYVIMLQFSFNVIFMA